MIFIIIFWILVSIIFYTYLGFGLILYITSKLKSKTKRELTSVNYIPKVSVIIAAYNEEKVIEDRIDNLLESDYPSDKLEIIVASDGSQDETVNKVTKYNDHRVRVLDFKQNQGRAYVHNQAVKSSSGEIIFFTDADTIFYSNFISKITQNFSDEKLGCVAGNLTFSINKNSHYEISESLYWKYERMLRCLESRLGILPFASGACLAMRRKIFEKIDFASDVDNVIPLKTIIKGYKVLYDNGAKSFEKAPASLSNQFTRRYRIAARSMRDILIFIPAILKNKKFGVLWVIVSHRLLRWWVSFALPIIFISNLFLLNHSLLYTYTLLFQTIIYLIALVGWISEKMKFSLPAIFKMPVIYMSMNWAFILATIDVITGKSIKTYSRTT